MRFITALVAAMAMFSSAAQSGFERFAADAQVRDAAVSPSGDAVFLAIQDRNELWKVSPEGAVEARAHTNRAPVAVSVSADGEAVAVANSLPGTISLFRAGDLGFIAHVTSGGGPIDIAALPGGGFAVANFIGDSVTLVDVENPEQPVSLPVEGVPSAVAASEGYLAVATRVPAALRLYPQGSRSPVTVALPGTPHAVAAASRDRFAVATDAAVLLIDAGDGAVAATRELRAEDLAAVGDDVYALTGDAVLRLEADSLKTVDSWPTSAATAGALHVANGTVAVALPQARAWQAFRGAPQAVAVAAADGRGEALRGPDIAPAPEVTDEPLREPILVAAEPAPAEEALEEPAPVPAVAEEAAPQPEAVAEEPSVPNAGEAGAVLLPAPRQKPETPAGEIVPPPNVFRQPPLGLGETRAPRSGQRPSAIPIPDFSEPTFGDTLRGDLGIMELEGGFRQPNLDIIENMTATDELLVDREGDQLQEVRAKGDVRLSLDNTDFAADYFYYNALTGNMEIRGEIRLEQELSTLTASELDYDFPTEEEAAALDPEVVGPNAVERRVSLGKLHAIDLEIHEPNRDVLAKRIDYDFATRTGELEEFRGRAGIYYFGGRCVRVLGPASADAEDVWITTCNLDPPHYRIRIKSASLKGGQVVVGQNAQLQLGAVPTPVIWPRWAHNIGRDSSFDFDFDSGHSADIGYYVNFGQRFAVNPDLDLGFRLMPTTQEGVGFGLEAYYDYRETPASPFYRSRGEVRTLYTTEDRGYAEFYHRQDIFDEAVLRLQLEQWSDREFYKDFFYDAYRNRTAPRTFANLTYAQPEYIATATVRQSTNGFVRETERLPEATYHLLERRLLGGLYFSFDTINGYNEREPANIHALRSVNVARLTYPVRLLPALTLTPFVESELTWYSDGPRDDESDFRFSNLVGTTLQSRFQRSYPGFYKFEGFKHVVVPSITLSYRPEPTMGVEETPRFDTYDNVYGRSRIEGKVDNIVFGRDAETKDVWQVARFTLYQGSDFWNELRRSDDYEIELDLRPRPWWGWLLTGEHHSITGDFDLDEPYLLERIYAEAYEELVGEPLLRESEFQYNVRYGDYDRLLTYLYYDNRERGGRFNGRLGYAYTSTLGETFNREVLYGAGYRLGEHWGVAAEHRYDFDRGELTRQEYEVSRDLHCWEAAVQVRERESGWDFGVEFSIKAFPGTGVKF